MKTVKVVMLTIIAALVMVSVLISVLSLDWGWQTAQAQSFVGLVPLGVTRTDTQVTAGAADVTIPANARRLYLSIQVQDEDAGIRVSGAGGTASCTKGDILNASTEASQGGGYAYDEFYKGAYTICGIGGASVTANVVEVTR